MVRQFTPSEGVNIYWDNQMTETVMERPAQPTPQPTNQPTPQPTDQPTPQSTDQPTPQPTDQPTTEAASGELCSLFLHELF